MKGTLNLMALLVGAVAISGFATTVEFQYGLNGNTSARFKGIRNPDGNGADVKEKPGAILIADG